MSTENQTNPPATSARKTRGAAVPTINLGKAMELMRKVWDKEKRNAAPIHAVLSHWDYGTKSSGGFQAVASLKRFGLLEEEGGGDKRTVKLSTLSLDLLKNEAVNAGEFQRLLKEAALKPKYHQILWTKYGENLPSDTTLTSFLVFDLHFGEDTAKQFIKEYKDTIGLAKLREGDTFKETDADSEENRDESKNEAPNAPAASHQRPNPGSVAAPQHSPAAVVPPAPSARSQNPLPPMNASLRYLPIPLDIGDAPIPVGMSEGDFDLLLETLKLWKKKIVRTAKEEVPEHNDFPCTAIWKRSDSDKPITIIGVMGRSNNGDWYYQSEDRTGIPEFELEFE